jgi:hypothetical protein
LLQIYHRSSDAILMNSAATDSSKKYPQQWKKRDGMTASSVESNACFSKLQSYSLKHSGSAEAYQAWCVVLADTIVCYTSVIAVLAPADGLLTYASTRYGISP